MTNFGESAGNILDAASCCDFSGVKKPDVNDFLEEFVSEVGVLIRNGFNHNDRQYSLTIKHFTCELPALSFIKQTKGHTGYSSCPKSCVVGDFNDNRVCFLNNAILRTEASFRAKVDNEHHVGVSPLLKIQMDMIKSVPIDPMHLLFLGIVKKVVNICVSGNKLAKFSSHVTQDISKKLVGFRTFVPYEFNRKPRALTDIKYWKATEFRNFVLYYGVVALKDCGNDKLYKNFLLLHSIVYLLSDSRTVQSHVNYVKTLMKAFLDHSRNLYGDEFFP